ncbi:DNA repair protein RecO [Desulfurobacterium thermolithotrophum]|uniref:DNA repair protein RecO n=1 Tax=Desulfurobacterium thermolithotrophum TaxID=64160 RepID=UPI0013CFD3DA|nr:DNA repair protein RecO [Desulfurobacterium thermolithotrophum]
MRLKGFVLRSKHLGSNLKHITAFTDKLGKVDFIVKLKRGDFPLKFDLFSLSSFQLNQKGEGYELKEADLIKSYFPESIEKFFYLSKISKLLIPYHLVESKKLFRLIEAYFSVEKSYSVAYTMFLLKFAFIEGIFPVLTKCVNCSSKKVISFSIEKGGVVCQSCVNSKSFSWNFELSKLALNLAKNSFEKMKDIEISYVKLEKINKVFETHIKYRLS